MSEIISPIDGQPAYHFDLLGHDAVGARLTLAAATSRGWRDSAIEQRVALCRGMLAAYATQADQNAEEITRMMGKPLEQARAEFERTMVERVEYLCEVAPEVLADQVLPEDEKSADFERGQITAAIEAGAQLLLGDEEFDLPDRSRCYLAPQVLVDVDHSMALMHEETFGPAIGIARVANESEGIALMNDSDFGLTASIWSGDFERACRLAEDVDAGTVFADRCDYLDPALAWTGIKDSGFGCSLSPLVFQSVTRPKSYHLRQQSENPA